MLPRQRYPQFLSCFTGHEKGRCVSFLGKFDLRSQVDYDIQDFKSEKDSFNLGSQVDHDMQNVNRLGSFDLGSSKDRVSHTQRRLSRVDESLDEFTLAPQGDSTTVNASNRNSAFLYADADSAPKDNITRNITSSGIFSDRDRLHVSIHALDSSAREDTSNISVSVFPPTRVPWYVCAKGSALTIYRNLRERSVEISCSIDSAIRQERSCSREPKR